jgi:hypothetical protein
MKIKKNGITINLTEGDIKKLRKSLITEQDVITLEEKVSENTAAIYELKKWRMETDRKLQKWVKQNPPN